MLPSICGCEPHSSCDRGDGQPPLQTDVLVTDGEAVSAVSLSSCCKCHQLADPPFPHHRPHSLPFEGIVGCRTNPGQEIRWIAEAPYLQTSSIFLVFHIHGDTFNFLQGWGDCDQRNVRLVKKGAWSC